MSRSHMSLLVECTGYLPFYLHACFAASHDVTHFTKGCPTECGPLPEANLRKQITEIRYSIVTAAVQNWNKSFIHIQSNIVPERFAERVWWTKSQSPLLNIYFRLWGYQSSSLLLIHFRYSANTCSHCTKVWQKAYPICEAPLSRSARRSFAPL